MNAEKLDQRRPLKSMHQYNKKDIGAHSDEHGAFEIEDDGTVF